MNSITSLFQQAQLAEAAYADLGGIAGLVDTQPFIDRLTASGMSLAQATALVSQWRVVHHIPDTASGFSATLFERLDATGNGIGEFNLAIRGSTFDGSGRDFAKDFQADVGDIFADGIALDQLVDLYNYWQRLRTPSTTTYDAAKLVTLQAETLALRAAYLLNPAAGLAAEAVLRARGNVIIDHSIVPGAVTVRTIQPVDSSMLGDASLRQGAGFGGDILALTTSGHSLGGHLAMAFTRLFPGANASALAVNGLGFRPTNTNVDRMFRLLGGAGGFDAANIYNVFGLEGLEFAAQNTALLKQVGGYQGIYIESAAPTLSIALGHGVEQMTDSLAVYDLFAKIDPALNTTDPAVGIGKITDILKAASGTPARSLESALDSLRKLFKDPAAPSIAPTATDNRQQFYQNLSDLLSRIPAGALTVDSLVGRSAQELFIAAGAATAEGLAYRYALRELNSFAALGADYTTHNQGGALEVYDETTGTGALTGRYLEDRAAFLKYLLQGHLVDSNPPADPSFVGQLHFSDGASNEQVTVLGVAAAPTFIRYVRFADPVNPKPLDGGAFDDRLYGAAGKDVLIGNAGSDYLEGGSGVDQLNGGTGSDILVGGKDADVLNGGLGSDVYFWNRGDGSDTITDANEVDGIKSGTIHFLGQSLAGNKTQVDPNNPRLFGDVPGIRYTLTGLPGVDGILTVVMPGEEGELRLVDFRSGDFGIVIPVPTVPQKTDKFGTASSDNSFSTQPGHEATLIADAPNQKVFGLGGNDRIIVAFAGAEAYGGLGHDYITNDTGDQKLFGEEGNDILIASGGNDELYGGLDNDALQGGADDDYLDGGEGNDFLDGGVGSDVIVGGAGQDFILGGGNMVPAITEGEIDDPNVRPFGVLVTNGVAGFTNMVGFPDAAGDGVNTIDAGEGDDTAFGGESDDFIDGGTGIDLLVGLSGRDAIFGSGDNDSIFGDGTQGHVTIGGQDIFTFPQFHAADYLDGGAGNDTYIVARVKNVYVMEYRKAA